MKALIIGFACVGGALAACASGAGGASSASTGAVASTANRNVVVRAATPEEEASLPRGYTLIKRNGVDFYCHTESVLGSHSQKKEVCQTKEQIDAERNRATKALDYTNSR